MFRSRFYVDGQVLHTERWWVTGEQKLHGPDEIEISDVSLPGRDGQLVLPRTRTVGASSWVLSIATSAATYPDLLRAKAALEAVLSPAGRVVTLREEALDGSGVVDLVLEATALMTTARVAGPWKATEHGADLEFVFKVPAGVWVEPAVTVAVNPAPGVHTAAELVGGSAPQYGQVLRFTPTSSSVSLTCAAVDDAAAWVQFASTSLTVGVEVVVDLAAFTATQGTTDVSGGLDLGPRRFRIGPDGQLRVMDASGISALTVTSRKAWW